MDKQTMVHPNNRIFSTKKKEAIKSWKDMPDPWKLRERGKSEKATCCMILIMWCSGKSETKKRVKKISDCWGLRETKKGRVGRIHRIFVGVKLFCIIYCNDGYMT